MVRHLLAAQAACAAKAFRRTMTAVAAAVSASMLWQDVAAAAPPFPVPSGLDATADEQRLKLRDASKAMRKLNRLRRRAARAPLESTVEATTVAAPMCNNARPATTWEDTCVQNYG